MKSKIPRNLVLAIGLDGQMAGILGIDRDWQAVTHYDSWLDTRCEKYMPVIKEWGEEEYIRITGCPVTYAHGPKKLWWKHERPDVYRRIAKFVVPSAYIAGRLAGLKAENAFIDYTHLHFTGFADVKSLIWSDKLLDSFDMDGDKMPTIVQPWDIIGNLQKCYALEMGLSEGIPIVAGCGDTAAALLGGGLTQTGRLMDIAGTASVLSCCVDRCSPDAESKTLIFARSVIPELWTPLAYINGGGECLTWYRKMINSTRDEGLSFDALNRMAENVDPGSDGLLFIPHFGGRVCPNNTDLRGSWIGLNWAHDRAHMYRAIMESIAFEYRYYLNTLEKLAGPIGYSHVHAVGGGAKGELFNQIKSDVLGIPYRTLHSQNTGLMANAVIAGFGIGIFSNIAGTIESFIQIQRKYMPNKALYHRYKSFVDNYETALDGMTALYKKFS